MKTVDGKEIENFQDFQEAIKKGLDDVKNGRLYEAKDCLYVAKHIARGNYYFHSDDYANAEREYLMAAVGAKDMRLVAQALYELGILYYKSQISSILQSKLYFKLALNFGIVEAGYYLATIYEWEKNTNNIDYDPQIVNQLYASAAEKSDDEEIKKLAREKIK